MEYKVGDLLRHIKHSDMFGLVLDIKEETNGGIWMDVEITCDKSIRRMSPNFADMFYERVGNFEAISNKSNKTEAKPANIYRIGDLLRHRNDEDSYAIVIDIHEDRLGNKMVKVQYPGNGNCESISFNFADKYFVNLTHFEILKCYKDISDRLTEIEKFLGIKSEEKLDEDTERRMVVNGIESIKFDTLQQALSAYQLIGRKVRQNGFIMAHNVVNLVSPFKSSTIDLPYTMLEKWGWNDLNTVCIKRFSTEFGYWDGWHFSGFQMPLTLNRLEYEKRFRIPH